VRIKVKPSPNWTRFAVVTEVRSVFGDDIKEVAIIVVVVDESIGISSTLKDD
jgi:hypothetical protein